LKKVSFDVWQNEPREDWVEIVCDEDDSGAGTVRMKLRELPDKEYQRLLLVHSVSLSSTLSASKALSNKADTPLASIARAENSVGEMIEVVDKTEANKHELVSKMVIDHDPSSFVVEFPPHAKEDQISSYLQARGATPEEIQESILSRKAELVFEKGSWLYKNIAQPGASDRMLKVYTESDSFFQSLFQACKRFQTLAWLDTNQVWEQARLAREKASRTFRLDVPEAQREQCLVLLRSLKLSESHLTRLTQGGFVSLSFEAVETEAPLL